MKPRLDNVVCVVTGAARGIGRAIAERCAIEGARVACLDVSEARLAVAVDEMRGQGMDTRAFVADVGNRNAVHDAFVMIEREFNQPVGALVNNAVWARFLPLAEIDPPTLDRMFAVGLQGSIWTMQAAVPQMQRRGGGTVVNLCSTNGIRGMANSIGPQIESVTIVR